MELHPEFGDFHSPEIMGRRGLEYYIPKWIASLEGWTDDRKMNNAMSFANYLDRAFARARRLKLLEDQYFQRWQQEYQLSRARLYPIT